MNTTVLSVQGLTKRYGGVRVFEKIDFDLAPAEVLGIIGPNGAGKTTLINVLCGASEPTEGKVTLGGKDITGKPFHVVSRLGLVRSFQQTNTFRNMTVRDNLGYALNFSKRDGADCAGIGALLDRFDLTARLDEQSDKLPYGLQKMLGLVLAYVSQPKVLLLDEPAAGLESRERDQVDEFIATARSQLGCSVMIVEHDIDMIRRLCSRVIVLDSGRILASGEPTEVLSRKDVLNAYVGATDDDAEVEMSGTAPDGAQTDSGGIDAGSAPSVRAEKDAEQNAGEEVMQAGRVKETVSC